MDIVNPAIEKYMRGLAARHDEAVLLEMEREGEERHFPIIGRLVGVTIEVLARAIGARRVFELGSGFGYSGYWFSRAVGPEGELHLTDGDPDNERKAMDYLGRAGLDGPVRFRVGDAVASLQATEGDFDVVYCDIDKHGYPEAWQAARQRIRPGGLYICDNVLWSGRVVEGSAEDDDRPEWTEAIRRHNRMIADDEGYLSTIVPTRDGVMVALRVG
ncbi:MAG: O-methyltransferase [Actinomycetota bacterium]|nr:O-methyltransferase [Actinomycetota bacterium]